MASVAVVCGAVIALMGPRKYLRVYFDFLEQNLSANLRHLIALMQQHFQSALDDSAWEFECVRQLQAKLEKLDSVLVQRSQISRHAWKCLFLA